MDSVQRLKETLRKNTFDYELLLRSNFKAIYIQSDGLIPVGFEVFEIRIRGSYINRFTGEQMPPAERFPANEDFGKTAWPYRRLKDAMKKYNSLT